MKNEVKFVILAWYFCFLPLCFFLHWCEKMGVYMWGAVCVCFCWSNFSVIYQTMLLCFLAHLVPDHADRQSLVFMTAGWSPVQPSWGTQWKDLDPTDSISWGILFAGRFQAEASPKDEGDFYLPKLGDNRRKNKDENLSSQLNLFRLIPASVIQTAANPRFP